MKIGFRLEIQSDLTVEQKDFAKKFLWTELKGDLDYFYKRRTGSYPNMFRRNVFGKSLKNEGHPELVFRRISRSKRTYGIVHIGTLKVKDNAYKNQFYIDHCYGFETKSDEELWENILWSVNNLSTHRDYMVYYFPISCVPTEFIKKPITELFVEVGDIKG